MAAPSNTTDKIVLNFGWKGPSSWNGGASNGGLDIRVVDLIFKNAKTEISVSIPQNISPQTVQKFSFTCRRVLAQETHPDSLKVTVEQIQNLTIKAGIFEEGSYRGPAIMHSSGKVTREKHLLRSNREIELEVPEELEIGQTYTLVVTSNDFSFSARLQKEKKVDNKVENKTPQQTEFLNRVKKMGEALIQEGMNNLVLASEGGGGVFDSNSTNADVFAHGMQGVIRAGKHMNPEIKVPYSKPSSESIADLKLLSVAALESLFETTFILDKEFEIQRLKAASAGDIKAVNSIMNDELANSQLLISIGEALEGRGIKPQIPQSVIFQSKAKQSTEEHIKSLKELQARLLNG